MEKATLHAILAMHSESTASILALEIAVHALIETHHNPAALLQRFDRRAEQHHAQGLASPIGDAVINGVQKKAAQLRQVIHARLAAS